MPTYEYACKSCGEHLEVVQSFKDDALTTCPSCGGSLRKVFGSIGIAFKGSGFYRNDSRPAPPSEKTGTESPGAASSGAASSGTPGSPGSSSSESSGSGSQSSKDKSGPKSGSKSDGKSDGKSSGGGSKTSSTTAAS